MPLHEASNQKFTRRIYALAALIIVLAIIAGVVETFNTALGNSDQPCVRTVTEQYAGSCGNGSWTQWSATSNTTDSAGNRIFQEQRTYTGTQENIQASFRALCNAGVAPNAVGTYNSTVLACQIVESRTRTVAVGTGGGNPDGSTGTTNGTISDTSSNATTGAVISQGSSGSVSYADLQDAKLATVALKATPSLVKRGDTSTIAWTVGHVAACTVTGNNGDSWTGIPDVHGGTVSKVSSAIQNQTTYNLSCSTRIGTTLADTAIVNIIPTYEEQ